MRVGLGRDPEVRGEGAGLIPHRGLHWCPVGRGPLKATAKQHRGSVWDGARPCVLVGLGKGVHCPLKRVPVSAASYPPFLLPPSPLPPPPPLLSILPPALYAHLLASSFAPPPPSPLSNSPGLSEHPVLLASALTGMEGGGGREGVKEGPLPSFCPHSLLCSAPPELWVPRQ